MGELWELAPERVLQLDSVATAYDRYRPGYPEAMYKHLADIAGLRADSQVIEVGAGTGTASLPLAKLGCRLLAIEAGGHLAAIAAEKLRSFATAEVVVERFEEWQGQESSCDLVFAADSWHWIDSAIGFVKAAWLLRTGGTLAIASHRVLGFRPLGFDDRLRERTSPRASGEPPDTPAWGPDPEQWGQAIAMSGLFDDVERGSYRFGRVLDANTFVALQNTYGVNLNLPPAHRAWLNDVVTQLTNAEFGGAITKIEEAVLFTARRT